MNEQRALHALMAGGWRDVAYRPFREGIEICDMYEDGAHVALLRYQPGAQVPRHRHQGLETVIVLQGSQSDEGGTYGAGTCVFNPRGSEHSVWSDEGCVVLIQWVQPVYFIDESETLV